MKILYREQQVLVTQLNALQLGVYVNGELINVVDVITSNRFIPDQARVIGGTILAYVESLRNAG